ncbi:MAG: putative oxidoreductase C-terminal domain-containing protein [Planctomycetota bacterium]|jgi:predicted dehydrogenase
MKKLLIALMLVTIALAGCQPENTKSAGGSEVKLITLNPGHFNAALVQNIMYSGVNPAVHVYAPEVADVNDHLNWIERFNTRANNPTDWVEVTYRGDDYLEKMISDRAGNVVVISGNNANKIDTINRSIRAGFHVLADQPMVISPDQFRQLTRSFQDAQWRLLLLYEMMPERYEIATMLQKELSQIEPVFGQLQTGTLDNPAVAQESVHHFLSNITGIPIKRPVQFFDPNQQGEGLANRSAHLIDLIQWGCFPEQIIRHKKDIKMLNARRWTTPMTHEQYSKVTQCVGYPKFLIPYVEDGKLAVYSNGEMNYTIKGIHAKVSVTWDYQAPEGTGDTHYSVMRGTRSSLIIRQGAAENYKRTLYVEAVPGSRIDNAIHRAVYKTLQQKYPGVMMQRVDETAWKIIIPDKYHVDHEAHFAQAMKQYLQCLKIGKLPTWEVPNMIAKYYTTTEALKAAGQ